MTAWIYRSFPTKIDYRKAAKAAVELFSLHSNALAMNLFL
jgi:hypothetical protein